MFKIHNEGKRTILFINDDEKLHGILDTYAKDELGLHSTPAKTGEYPCDGYSQTFDCDYFEFTGKEELLLEFLETYYGKTRKAKRGRPSATPSTIKPVKTRGRPRKATRKMK